jgi:hypothetical protein
LRNFEAIFHTLFLHLTTGICIRPLGCTAMAG